MMTTHGSVGPHDRNAQSGTSALNAASAFANAITHVTRAIHRAAGDAEMYVSYLEVEIGDKGATYRF